jgi:hypothetical protein
MPKLVDYAARFEFVREAAFAVVLDHGPSAQSRQALADALGTSLSTIRRLVGPDASLAGIAAQAVERRRAHGRFGMPRGEDRLRNAARLLESVLPDAEERIDEEIVWLRLVLLHPRPTPTLAAQDVRERYQLFDRDWADDPEPPAAAADDAPMARAIAEREYFVRLRMHRLLDELGIASQKRRPALRQLRLHLDGIVLGLSLGHLTPQDAAELRDELLLRLRDLAAEEGHPGPVTLTA